jgi:hypothetical protein
MRHTIRFVGNLLWREGRRTLGQWPHSTFIALAIGAAALLSQTTDSSSKTAQPQAARVITGKVINGDGEPLPEFGVLVSLDWPGSSPSFGKMPDVRTDDHGEYRISGLASNRYWVAASAPNYSYPCEDPHWETPEMGYAGAGTPVVVDLQSAALRDRVDFVVPRVMLRQAEKIEGPSAEVSGDVVDVLRGKPVKNALVTFRLRNSGLKAPCYATESDGGGRFRLPNAPPGEYYAEAHHVGLGQVLEGEDYYPIVRFAAGQPAQVSLKMIPSAVISGRVIDEDGHPVPGANVAIGHNQYVYGMPKQVVFAPSATTDDRGEFRLWQLGAGAYYPRASPPALTTPSEREIAHERGTFTAPSFLGDTTDFAHAKPITVASGDDSRVGDIVLRTERRFAVRGTFQDYDSSLRYSVLLKDPPLSAAEPMFSVGCGRIPPKYSDLISCRLSE